MGHRQGSGRCSLSLSLILSLTSALILTACSTADQATPTVAPVVRTPEAATLPTPAPTIAELTTTGAVTPTGTLPSAVLTTTSPITGAQAITVTPGATARPTLTASSATSVTTPISATPPLTATQIVTTASSGVGAAQRTMRASVLLGHPLQNRQHGDMGQIIDLLLDWSSGRVLYAMVGYGGLLNLGQKIFPIPFVAFHYEAATDSLVLNIANEALQDAPSYAVDAPMMTDQQFQRDVATFWRNSGLTGTQQAPDLSTLSGDQLYVSALLGSDVQNFQGEDIGQVQDLMLDLGAGVVSYAVLSFGGFLGIGDKLFAIPLTAFEATSAPSTGEGELAKVTLRLDINEEALAAAPGFDPDAYPDTAAPDWDAAIRRYWH